MAGIAPIESSALLPSEATLRLQTPLSSPESVRGAPGAAGLGAPQGSTEVDSFGSILTSTIDEVNRADFAASRRVEALSVGATDDLHGTMISVKEAEIGIKLVGTVRNKILDAFQELWRTSV
jgi:flagellar hook-basal body complex protein FliE